jgi:hypothetical protein
MDIDPNPRGIRLRGVDKITEFLSAHLGAPGLTKPTVRGWINAGKIRAGRFGGQITALDTELAEDVRGTPIAPAEKPAA